MRQFDELNEFEDEVMDDEDSQLNKYITFTLGNEEYAIEIRYIVEIVGLQKITELPDMPDFLNGVINLRGDVIPIIDVRKRFKLDPKSYTVRTCIIIVSINEASIGLIVDEVSEVLDIEEENISVPPKTSTKQHGRFVKGIGKVENSIKIILDVEKILSEDELSDVQTI